MRGAVRRAGSPWPAPGTTRVGRSVCTAARGVLPGWRGTGPCKLPLGGAIVDVEGGFGGGRRERDALILRSRGVRSLSSRRPGCLAPGCCACLSPRICPAPRRAVRPRRVSPPLGSLPPPLPAAAARFCCLPYPDSFFPDVFSRSLWNRRATPSGQNGELGCRPGTAARSSTPGSLLSSRD